MKVISIIQPWATLIALGEKKFETRSWKTKYRGKIGIHSSKKVDKRICKQEPFKSILAKHGFNENNLLTGVILAIGNITDCYEIGMLDDRAMATLFSKENGSHWIEIDGIELEFGWFEDGRFAWELSDVRQIGPIPAKGQLGLWNYDLKD